MNYKEDICVDVSDIIKRLQGKIKLDFEVERMEPLFEIKKLILHLQKDIIKQKFLLLTSHHTVATVILVLMPVLQPQKLHS